MRRAFLILLIATSFAGLMASAASAALWLTFSTTRAAPGATVTVRTGGSGALSNIPPTSPPLRVFLVRTDQTGVTSPNDRRLIPLGELTVDAEGNGELRFTVPDVAAREYTTLTHCVPCAPFSAGRELLPTGPGEPFVVLEGGAGSSGFPVLRITLGAAGGVLILAVVVWVARSRPRRQGLSEG